MSLSQIVKDLGGDLYDGGMRANIPAPGHSPADRSVSLVLRDGRVLVHSFSSSTDWREVLDDLRERGLIDDENCPTGLGFGRLPAGPTAPASDTLRLAAARRFWDDGRPLRGTLSERHCRLRRIGRPLPGPDVVRHCSAAPVSAYGESRSARPALLTAIRDAAGGFSAVEITYLAANGQRARDLRLSRKTVGSVPPGSAIRIDSAAPEMLVAEGLFTALSATERFSLPGWALMSERNLRTWIAPEEVRSVLIAADRGVVGAAAAELLAERLRARRVASRVAFPPAPFGDWNEWGQAQGR